MNEKTLKRYKEINEIAEKGGYHLNPDEEMTIPLIDGLVVNTERYGDEICPCRLFKGTLEDNLDIVCPCYYRDDDLAEYGACFCGLYVTQELIDEGGSESQVPERRPPLEKRKKRRNKKKMQTLVRFLIQYGDAAYADICAQTQSPLQFAPFAKQSERDSRDLFKQLTIRIY